MPTLVTIYKREHYPYLDLYWNWKSGRWEDATINRVLDLVKYNACIKNFMLAINLIRDARGENKQLNEILKPQRFREEPAFVALIGSYYLANGYEKNAERCCRICCETQPDIMDKYLALSVFAAKKSLKLPGAIKTTLKSRMNILEKAKGFTHIYQDFIGNRTVAIVGNAAVEVGGDKGREIDAHDLVVRFNNFSLEERFRRDYGSKTHLWVRSPSIKEVKYRRIHGLECVLISGYPVVHKPTMMWRWLDQLVADQLCFAFFSQDTYHELCKRLSAPPSAGMQFIYSLFKMRNDMQRVSVYGFDFNQSVSYQYYSRAKASNRHNWSLEYKLFREIAEVAVG